MPVKVNDLDHHVMHYERYEVPRETQEVLNPIDRLLQWVQP